MNFFGRSASKVSVLVEDTLHETLAHVKAKDYHKVTFNIEGESFSVVLDGGLVFAVDFGGENFDSFAYWFDGGEEYSDAEAQNVSYDNIADVAQRVPPSLKAALISFQYNTMVNNIRRAKKLLKRAGAGSTIDVSVE